MRKRRGGCKFDFMDTDDNVVARKPCCNRVVFVAANLPEVMDREMYKEIGKLVKAGCTIEHMSTEDVRKAKFGCKCDEPAK